MTVRRCTACGRVLDANETAEEHLEVCGGVDDSQAEIWDDPESLIEEEVGLNEDEGTFDEIHPFDPAWE